ncbi:MAG: LutC/YkgG family protein [Eggerthellaceae bacterium]|jgi:L-lactate dehydrogenase complex protein LldG
MTMREPTLEQFLAPISRSLGHPTPHIDQPLQTADMIPPHVTDGLSHDELVERFISEATALRAEIHRATPATLPSVLSEAIDELGGGKVAVPDDERIASLQMEESLNEHADEVVRWDPSQDRDYNVNRTAECNIGLTFATAAIAETGTIMQVCSEKCGRSISLLPNYHIAIVDTKSVVSALRDALKIMDDLADENGDGLPSQVCFISGPSNTSDIELVRVDGVHGPIKVSYIMLDE